MPVVDRLHPPVARPETDWSKEIETEFLKWSQNVADFSRIGFQFSVVTKTAAYTVNKRQSVILCDGTGGAFTVTLPTALSMRNRGIYIKKIDAANNITVDGAGAEKIDGAATQVLDAQWEMIGIVSNGTAWYIIADTR